MYICVLCYYVTQYTFTYLHIYIHKQTHKYIENARQVYVYLFDLCMVLLLHKICIFVYCITTWRNTQWHIYTHTYTNIHISILYTNIHIKIFVWFVYCVTPSHDMYICVLCYYVTQYTFTYLHTYIHKHKHTNKFENGRYFYVHLCNLCIVLLLDTIHNDISTHIHTQTYI